MRIGELSNTLLYNSKCGLNQPAVIMLLKKILFLLFAFVLVIPCAASRAQDAASYSFSNAESSEDGGDDAGNGETMPGEEAEGESEEDIFDEIDLSSYIKPVSDEYNDGSFLMLSKMYWAIDKLDIEDNEAIDNYLLINECMLYNQFYHNDFEWDKIREATRTHIKKTMKNFPTTIEIIMPIELARYDVDKKEFIVSEESRIMGMRRLDFSNNPFNRETCNVSGEIKHYPKNIILVLNRPFALDRVPVRPEIAEMYLEDARQEVASLSAKVQMDAYKRKAFLRLKIRISRYKETVRSIGGDLRAVVFGKIEGIEVYADDDKMKPMYISKLQDKRLRHFRAIKSGVVEPEEETEEDQPQEGSGTPPPQPAPQ